MVEVLQSVNFASTMAGEGGTSLLLPQSYLPTRPSPSSKYVVLRVCLDAAEQGPRLEKKGESVG